MNAPTKLLACCWVNESWSAVLANAMVAELFKVLKRSVRAAMSLFSTMGMLKSGCSAMMSRTWNDCPAWTAVTSTGRAEEKLSMEVKTKTGKRENLMMDGVEWELRERPRF